MLTWGWYPYYPPRTGGAPLRAPAWVRKAATRMTSSGGRGLPQTPEREALIEAAHLTLGQARQAKLDAATPEERARAIAKIDDTLDVLLELRGR